MFRVFLKMCSPRFTGSVNALDTYDSFINIPNTDIMNKTDIDIYIYIYTHLNFKTKNIYIYCVLSLLHAYHCKANYKY